MKRIIVLCLLLTACGGGGGDDGDHDDGYWDDRSTCKYYCTSVCKKAINCLGESMDTADPNGVCASTCLNKIISDGNLNAYMCDNAREVMMSMNCNELLSLLDASMRDSLDSLVELGISYGTL